MENKYSGTPFEIGWLEYIARHGHGPARDEAKAVLTYVGSEEKEEPETPVIRIRS